MNRNVGAFLSGLLCTSAGAAAGIVMATAGADIEVGCTVRPRTDGSGWYVLNDAGHQSEGCSGVVTEPTRLKVLHPVGAKKVVVVHTTADNDLAGRDIRAGASGGITFSYVYLFQGSSPVPVDPATLIGAKDNVWFSGEFR